MVQAWYNTGSSTEMTNLATALTNQKKHNMLETFSDQLLEEVIHLDHKDEMFTFNYTN